MKALSTGIKIFLVGVAVLIVIYFKKQGVTLETAAAFRLAGAAMIPDCGWNIIVYRWILLARMY